LSPSPEAVVPLPELLWGDWHAPADAIPNVTAAARPLRLAFNWDGGRTAWLQFDDNGDQALQSSALAAADGEIRVRADPASFGCNADQEGRYRWSRSADGLFLTLALVEDACAARGFAFARTWVHSLSAVNDGGIGMVPNDPWIQVQMPKERLAMSGGTDAADIHTFDDSAPFRSLLVLKNPMGYAVPCETDNKPFDLEHATDAVDDYLSTLPGLRLVQRETTIDGIDAVAFNAVAKPGTECAAGEVSLFRSRVPAETEATWSYAPGDEFFACALVLDGDVYVFTYGGDGVTQADAAAVIGSIKFLDELPRTPA
jgi:hypothetical protein